MNAAKLRQNTEIKVKKNINNAIKADDSSTTKHRKLRLKMNVVLITKYSSIVMQDKRKLRKCYTRFFFLFVMKILLLLNSTPS